MLSRSCVICTAPHRSKAISRMWYCVPRSSINFSMKSYGDSVREIAADLGVSEPRVYQLIARAKAIGKEFRQNNG